MFAVPRRIVYSRNFKSLLKDFRFICSDQSQQFQVAPSYTDSDSSSDSKKKEYGEKEIFLLNTTDVRTPLPGNTGIVPLTVYFPDVSRSLPLKSQEKSSIFSPSPEERQENMLTQLAFTAVENVLSPTSSLECVIHECPQLLKKDFADLFPNVDIRNDNLIVMTLCQRTEQDMKLWNEKVDMERGSLEESFVITARAICFALKDSGYWADYIHPSSGQAAMGSSSSKTTMFETDLRYNYFGFTIEDLGCCKVISHHLWGSHAFIGAIFTNAPLHSSEIQAIISKNPSLSRA